ncbi:MAG: hypothetical protein ACFFD4_24235 [Candidatus Odinarchaeota archaeon]
MLSEEDTINYPCYFSISDRAIEDELHDIDLWNDYQGDRKVRLELIKWFLEDQGISPTDVQTLFSKLHHEAAKTRSEELLDLVVKRKHEIIRFLTRKTQVNRLGYLKESLILFNRPLDELYKQYRVLGVPFTFDHSSISTPGDDELVELNVFDLCSRCKEKANLYQLGENEHVIKCFNCWGYGFYTKNHLLTF